MSTDANLARGAIGGRLVVERLKRGLTQEEFARLGKASRTAQVRYEAGQREPGAEYLASLAAIAGVDVLYVLTGRSSDAPAANVAPLTNEERASAKQDLIANVEAALSRWVERHSKPGGLLSRKAVRHAEQRSAAAASRAPVDRTSPLQLAAARRKAEFIAKGESIAAWAEAHGFARDQVYLVLNGYSQCRYGRAHAIAVALGIKPSTIGEHFVTNVPRKYETYRRRIAARRQRQVDTGDGRSATGLAKVNQAQQTGADLARCVEVAVAQWAARESRRGGLLSRSHA